MSGPRHFRRRPRPAMALRVRYRMEGEALGQERDAVTHDLGLGGGFVVTDEPVAVGEKLTLAFEASGNREPLILWGQVKWTSDGAGDRPRGMGVEFEHVGSDGIASLREFLARTGVGIDDIKRNERSQGD